MKADALVGAGDRAGRFRLSWASPRFMVGANLLRGDDDFEIMGR